MNFSTRAWAMAGLIVAGFAACLVLNLPGHLSYDSLIQLLEGRTGAYGGWHPPVMSWLLGLADRVAPGTSLFVLFDTALIYCGLLSLLWLNPRRHWAALPVLVLILISPQFVLYPGLVWKDVLFAASLASGFLCLAHAGADWTDRRRRRILIGLSVPLLIAASLCRQNGFVALPFAAIALGGMAAMHAQRPFVAFAGWTFCTLAAFALFYAASFAALETRVTGQSSPLTQIVFLQSYDLAGAVATDRNVDLDIVHRDAPALEKVLRSDGARLYTPERNDTLASSAALQEQLNNADPATISGQWWELVRRHPMLYLKVRFDAFRWVFATPDPVACRPAFAGIGGLPDAMKRLKLAQRFDARDRFLTNYTSAFAGTPILSHPFFAAIDLVLLVILFRRRRTADIAMAGMILATFAFAATFFVISLACDYRYLYALDIAAMLSLFYVALDGLTAFTERARLDVCVRRAIEQRK